MIWEITVYTLKLLGRQVSYLFAAFFTLYNITVTLKNRKSTVGTGVKGTFDILCAVFMYEGSVCHSLVLIQSVAYNCEELVVGHILVFLGFDNSGYEAAHLTLSCNVTPSGLYTVATLDAIEHNGESKLSCKGSNGGAHIYGLTAVGTVSLGGNCDRAAFLGNANTVENRLDVGGLFFDRDWLNQEFDQRGHKSVREQILAGKIIHGLLECKTYKELVKGSLMIIKNKAGPFFGILCYFYSVFDLTENMYGMS